ncbi:MAG: glycosyltransferase family 2 protein, partial [Desulfovibrionaceae bacterium]|nr:glycosyltransferase family 2 protein [Desulfovibrionaceae bacterium]
MIQERIHSTPPPLVSIIIPVYNVEKYLEECLESACKQTLKDIEIICVDDGSTDRSREIIVSYAERDPRIYLIDSPHGGASSARNRGIEHARGTYIQFLDSDDYIEPMMSSIMYTTITTHNV